MQQLQQSGYNDAQLYDPTETSVRGIHAFFLILGEPEAYGLPPEAAGSNHLSEVSVDFGLRHRDRINHRDAPGIRVFLMTTNSPSEKRLEELREQAWKEGVVPGKGVDVADGPIPRKPGYYGQPVVKPPVWTWEIPIYFFMGGIAGMSAVIASGAIIFHQVDLARMAMWVAALGWGNSFTCSADHGSRPSAALP